MIKYSLAIILFKTILTNTEGNVRINSVNYNIPFILDKIKISYGRKFGVDLFKFNYDQDCKISKNDKEEWFAAFIEINDKCKKNIYRNIKDLAEQGADFIFISNLTKENYDLNVKKMNLESPVFILNNNQEKLINEINKLNTSNNSVYKITDITVTFPDEDESNINKNLDISLYYMVSDNFSYMFLEEFGKVYKLLVDKISFDPVAAIFKMRGDADKIYKYCISKGSYCSISNNNKILGRDLVIESLRQKCIYNTHPNKYFNYIKDYNDNCLESDNKKCFEKSLEISKIDKNDVENCINYSFITDSDTDFYDNDNILLMKEHEKISDLVDPTYPSLYINNKLYKGSADYNDILLFVCSFLDKNTNSCKKLNVINEDEEFSYFGLILLGIIIFFVGFLVVLFFCKQYTENQYKEEFNKKIGKYISEYSSMKDNEA